MGVPPKQLEIMEFDDFMEPFYGRDHVEAASAAGWAREPRRQNILQSADRLCNELAGEMVNVMPGSDGLWFVHSGA